MPITTAVEQPLEKSGQMQCLEIKLDNLRLIVGGEQTHNLKDI